MPDPNLQVSLLTPDEAEHYVRIRHETFRPTINKILYSRGEASQKTLSRVAQETRDGIAKGTLFLKCVDTTTGEVVAAARWRYVKPKQDGAKERTWDEVEASFLDIMQPYDESEPKMLDALFELFNANKRENLGTRPYYCLDTLATLAKHERRGAGSLLVKWGCDRADEAGVEAYLEASEIGAPMYARHGFVALPEMVLDLRKYGGEDVMRFIVSIVVGIGYLNRLADLLIAYAEAQERRACCLDDLIDFDRSQYALVTTPSHTN
jgi:GNAT superfamily N-acetyltransferase